MSMNKPRMMYFEESDVLHLAITDEKEAGSVELAPNVTAELNDRGELIGIEILDASQFVRDFVLKVAQTKMLKWPPQQIQDESLLWQNLPPS
jgi:uncharacterized protein YuzE